MALLDTQAFRRTSRHWSRWGYGLLALLVAVLTSNPATGADIILLPVVRAALVASSAAAPTAASEYALKAVFLFNFTKYVEWPATAFSDAQAPFVIGVLGDDPFGSVLDETVRGEKVNGRVLIIRHYSSKEEIKDCQILFISASEAGQLEQITATLKGRSVLTVGDFDKFTDRGGMIGLTMEKNKIHLKINLETAKAANLTISSNLLRVAEVTGHAKE